MTVALEDRDMIHGSRAAIATGCPCFACHLPPALDKLAVKLRQPRYIVALPFTEVLRQLSHYGETAGRIADLCGIDEVVVARITRGEVKHLRMGTAIRLMRILSLFPPTPDRDEDDA